MSEDSIQIDTALKAFAEPFNPPESDSFSVGAAQCRALVDAVDSLRLDVPRTAARVVAPDGESWRFEVIRAGRYFTDWEWGPDSSRGRPYLVAGQAFLAAARFDSTAFRR